MQQLRSFMHIPSNYLVYNLLRMGRYFSTNSTSVVDFANERLAGSSTLFRVERTRAISEEKL